jgi:hypothetical protein
MRLEVAVEVAVAVEAEKKGYENLVTLCFYWSHLTESNRRPTDYESVALPTELRWQIIYPVTRCFNEAFWLFCGASEGWEPA